MKTITSKLCLSILGFILGINLYAQDTLKIIPVEGSTNNCNGSAIFNKKNISSSSWQWFDNSGTTVLQTGGDTLKNRCIGNYTLKFNESSTNKLKIVHFYIGINPCTNSTFNVTFTSTPNNSSTAGTCNGSITVTATGGTSPYEFSLNNGALGSSNNFTALCNGVQNVQVKDKTGCFRSISATIDSPNNPCANSTLNATFTTTANTSTTAGSCNGALTVTATGGTSPYEFSLNNGTYSSSSNFTALCNGVQNVQVKDNAGCVKNLSATIDSPNNPCANSTLNPTFTITPNTSTVSNVCNGEINVTVTGGTSPYEFSFNNSNFGTKNSSNSLCNGSYSIQVKDNAGCVRNLTAIIGNANNNGKTCQAKFKSNPIDATGLKFHFKDTSRVDSGTITSFNWKMDGTIVGTTASIDQSFTQGKHKISLTIITSTGCEDTFIDSTDFPNFGNNCANSNLNATFTTTSNSSTTAGNCNGTLTITATGGTSPYQYSLNNGTLGSLSNFTALCNGVQNVQVKDNVGCVKNLTATIDSPNNPCTNSTLNATFTTTPNTSTTSGNCNGTLTVTATGGTSPYEFSLNNATFGSVSNFTALCNGSQTVQVKDKAGCLKTITAMIGSANNPCSNSTLNATFTTTPNTSTTTGSCNGEISVTPTGGKYPYVFSFNNGNFSSKNYSNGLCNGSYSIQVKDSAGCIKNLSATLGSANNPCANSTLNPTFTTSPNASTTGTNCNGGIKVTPVGGVSPYTFSINNGTFGTINNFINLCNDSYTIQVKDNAGCVKNITGIIQSLNNPCVNSTLNPTFTITPNTGTTSTTCNGAMAVNVEGGAKPYQFSFKNGQFGSTNNFTNLCNGSYTIAVKDSLGCIKTVTGIIEAPNGPCANSTFGISINVLNSTATYPNCNGALNTTITGTTNYTFKWNNNLGSTNLSPNNLCPGIYTISVTENGCTKTESRQIVQQNNTTNNCQGSTLAATFVPSPAASSTLCTGKIQINATGGKLPYKYSADNGTNIVSTNNFNNLCAGTYKIGVSDSLGCVIHFDAIIQINQNNTAPDPCIGSTLSGLVSSIEPTTLGNCVGKVAINANGGKFPYQFVLASTSTTSMTSKEPHFNNLCAGNYTVKIIDSLGCSKSINFKVQIDSNTNVNLCANTTLAASTSTTNAFNTATCNGKIKVEATGGQTPYKYSADNGVTFINQNEITNLCAGNYNVVVTDNIGCKINVTAKVTTEPVINTPNPCNGSTLKGYVSAVTPSATDSTCTGKFFINASGGHSPYKYNVVNNSGANGNALAVTTPFFNNLCAGNFTAVIIDSAGCIKSFPVLVPVDTASIVNPCKGSSLAITFVSTNSTSLATATCNGSLTATITGAANYTYSWSNGLGNSNLTQSALCPGMYKLTVNANGCIKTETGLVQVGAPKDPCTGSTLNGSIIYTVPTTAGNCIGKIGVYATGGAIPYSYKITANTSTGSTITSVVPNFNNLCEGPYSVIIKDSLGCAKNFIAKIDVEATPVNNNPCLNSTMFVKMAETNVSAQGLCDGSLIAIVSGAANYTYTWSNNLGSTNLTQSGLCPGIYKIRVTSNGCSLETIGKVGINVPTNPCVNSTLSVSLATRDVTGVNVCNGTIYSSVAGGIAPYEYIWNNKATTSFIDNLCHDTYKLEVKDAQGCKIMATGIIANYFIISTPSIALTGYVIPTGETSPGACDGFASAIAYGGKPPYTFEYSNNSTESATPYLCAGLQSVKIKDANGQNLEINFIITSPTNTIVNKTNPGNPSVKDSSFTIAVKNCSIDITKIDSAFIINYKKITNDSISVNWKIVDKSGITSVITQFYAISDTIGVFKFALQLYCPTKMEGQFLTAYDQLNIVEFNNSGNSAGISEIKNNKIKVYPNPFNDYVTISIGNDKMSEVSITDIVGKVIINKRYFDDTIKIDLSSLSTGTYIVTIKNNNTVTTEQIIK